jgi:type I restriction enzyme M protein
LSKLGNFVWGIADQLRGVYKPHQYGGVILPFTILRRLDCILEPTRDDVRVLAAKYTGGALDVQVKRKTGLNFYNTSPFDFKLLLEDPEGLRANLMDYVTSFSANIDVFERFKFENELATLDEKNRLYLVTSQFAEVDLHPDVVSNAEMGDLFEHLIYKFAEASNEEAGEHYTPRDAIRLMVDLLFAEDNKCGHDSPQTTGSEHQNRFRQRQCGRMQGAGGGTRTLKLSRARAPKTRAVASFATPALPCDRTVPPVDQSVGGVS